ncbi:MAG: hypothetical protein HFJ53_03375 [Clostridia bacterium]|jgi:g-D-glutamyl-meso-diaminopimelate peptidase|nr:hypothetical protein [Clostridia bacterium]
MNIIDTKNIYTYSKLIKDIKMLKEIYPFLSIKSIGKSVLDKSIKVIKIGEGKKEIFYSATYHANEWITSLVLMKFVEEVCKAYTENKDIYKYNIKTLIKDITLYVVPMVNPDGVDLVNGKLENSEVLRQIKKISNEYSNITYPNGWKANIKGVDLKIYQPICKVL